MYIWGQPRLPNMNCIVTSFSYDRIAFDVISEYCILCDSGATHHRLSDLMFCDYLRDKHLEVSWGDSSTSRPLGIGHLVYSWVIFQALVPTPDR